MKKVFLGIIIGVAVGVVIYSNNFLKTHFSPEVNSLLAEANQYFTYNTTPIHPFLIKEFEVWLSDDCPPIIVSVDVIAAAKARNEYYTDIVSINGRQVRAENINSNEYYQYEWLGRLPNGIHVIETTDYGGGSGIFRNLLFLKFATDKAYDPNGTTYKRLLMTVVRVFPLGDRDDGNIEVLAEKVIVSASKYRTKPTILMFE